MQPRVRSRSSSRTTPKWQSWSPPELKTAYENLVGLSKEEWAEGTAAVSGHPLLATLRLKFKPEECKPHEDLIASGTQQRVLEVLKVLGCDLRMKQVWEKLGNENEVVVFSFLESPMCLTIARICIRALAEPANKEIVTKQGWKKRHAAIAATARRLAKLLGPHPCVDRELLDPIWLFQEDALDEMAMDAMPELYEYLDTLPVGADRDRLGQLGRASMKSCISHCAPRTHQLLNRLAELSKVLANNPPFLSPKAKEARMVFNLSGALLSFFGLRFNRSFDEIVAVIIEVVTGLDTTSASVKMRRHRHKKHTAKLK